MPKANPTLNHAAANVRTFDAISVKYGVSQVERAARRAQVLGELESTRPAAYALAWALSTGRASSEFEAALCALPARKLAAIALDLASKPASVRDQWEALSLIHI